MNKKILTISIVAVFMLLTISFSTAVSSNITATIKKKESPLFGIRTRQAINVKFGEIIENIKTKYIGERVFFLPFQFLSLKWQKLTDDSLPNFSFEDCETMKTCDYCTNIVNCVVTEFKTCGTCFGYTCSSGGCSR